MKKKYSGAFSTDICSFIEFRKEQGYSVHATEQYLGLFDEYCCKFPPAEDVLTRNLIHSWLRHDISLGYKDMGGRGRAIRGFAQYLRGLGKEAYVVPVNLFSNGSSSFAPYIPTSSELSAFFDAADNLEAWMNGDKFAPNVAPVIFRLMYTSGLRPQEACALLDQDIDLMNGQILIRVNKRKKERIVVVSDEMLRLLNEYSSQKEKLFVRTSYFFPRIDGSQYTNQQLGKLCDKCWQIAHPGRSPTELPRLRPYDFRHAYATTILQRWLDEGKDLSTMLPYLRTYMGHEHFEDTAYYIHILPDHLVKCPNVNWNAIDSIAPEVSIWEQQ